MSYGTLPLYVRKGISQQNNTHRHKSVLTHNSATRCAINLYRHKSVQLTYTATNSVQAYTATRSVQLSYYSATKSVRNKYFISKRVFNNPLQIMNRVETATRIKKIVLGNFNQGDNKFGNSSGKQCSCMSLTAICWTSIRKITIWKAFDNDFILVQGDKLYKSTQMERYLSYDEIPTEVTFEMAGNVNVEFVRVTDGFCDNSNEPDNFIDQNYFYSDNTNGIIFVFKDMCVAILKDTKRNVYVFDSHSRNEKGEPLPDEDGKSALLMFASVNDVKNYIFSTYENLRFFQIVYVKINSINKDIQSNIEKCFQRFKTSVQTRTYHAKILTEINSKKRKHYENNCEKIKKQKNKHYENNCEKIKAQKHK